MRFSFLRNVKPLGALALVLTLALAGGCVFAPAGKRGNIEDELDVEREHALRALDGADAAGALPALAELAENAGRMDEVPLRIQAIMLIATTLDSEADLWPPERAEKIREAARAQAANALRDARDNRRFGSGDTGTNREAMLLEYDARVLASRLRPGGEGELESLLRAAQQAAGSSGDVSRAVAWRLALCQMEAKRGNAGEAERWFSMAKSMYDAESGKKKGSGVAGASESLELAFAEARADMAFYGGDAFRALADYERSLDMARKLRRRGEIYRLLVKLTETAEKAGDNERAAWYRRRAKAVARKSTKSPGDRILGKEETAAAKTPENK